MPCTPTTLPNGSFAIVCGAKLRHKKCACGSGKLANLLCDWKVPERQSGTCDKFICSVCTHKPAPKKDLCPDHATIWKAR